MSIEIIIVISDKENIGDIQAVGTKDLNEHFLPKAGIKADHVSIVEHVKREASHD